MARSAIALLSQPRQGGTTPPGGQASGACLARRPAIGSRGVGRIRLGYSRRTLLRRVRVQPVRRTRAAYRYCTKRGSGRVTAVFSRSGRVELIVSTARAAAFQRSYATRRRMGAGLFRASPGSPRLLGVSRGRVRFVAVASDRLLRNPRRLVRDLRLAQR